MAQITGAFIYTDNQHRWNEVTGAINDIFGESYVSPWETLGNAIADLDFTFESNPIMNLQLRRAGKFGQYRKMWRKIYLSIKNEQDVSRIAMVSQSLADELKEIHTKAKSEWDSVQKEFKNEKNIPIESNQFHLNGKIHCRIPSTGFGLNNVHRLLLSYGGNDYSRSVPMAMFLNVYPQ